MFDPKVYKDEWNQSSSSPSGSQNSNASAATSTPITASGFNDDKKDEKKDDFPHLDGTKTEEGNQVYNKFKDLDLGGGSDQKKDDSDDKIDQLANDMIEKASKEGGSQKKESEDDEADDDVKIDAPEAPKDFSEKTPEADNTGDGLEKALDTKTAEAIKKLEDKKEEKNKEKARIDEEISNLDSKIKDLNALSDELKSKIKQFDTTLSEIE